MFHKIENNNIPIPLNQSASYDPDMDTTLSTCWQSVSEGRPTKVKQTHSPHPDSIIAFQEGTNDSPLQTGIWLLWSH